MGQFMTAGACLNTSLAAAIESARELVEIWGDDFDQIEGHLESEGFPQAVVDKALIMVGVS
jgi:translation initiation factor 1 (eIF-1/SUI1)